VLAIYRIWLGIIESFPDYFYVSSPDALDESYRHIEPTYRHKFEDRLTPTVDLGKDAGRINIAVACGYFIVSLLAPWCPLPQ
jgi:hypothetical protein